MPLAVSLRKIVTGERQTPCENDTRNATHPLTHGFTVAASLHRATVAGPRERGHWASTANDTCTARDTGTGGWRRGCTKTRARHDSCRTGVRHGQHQGVFAQVATGAHGALGRTGATRCGRRGTSARTGQRRHTTQPPSQWRSGRVRARALRRSLPNLPDHQRTLPTRGEQTRHASPSNTVMRLKRI